MLDTIRRKAGTAGRVLREHGAAHAGAVALDQLNQWIHRRPGGFAKRDGCRFQLSNLGEQGSVFLRGDYETDEVRAAKRYLDRSIPVIELGGSLGIVACITNKRLLDPSRHVVVEANPRLIPILEYHRKLNRCGFEIYHRAIAYDAETVAFSIGEDTLTGSLFTEDSERVLVRSISLEALAKEAGFPRFSLVCDIEGAEVDLVEREHELLSRSVDIMILETHSGIVGAARTSAMLKALERAGFIALEDHGGKMTLRNHSPRI